MQCKKAGIGELFSAIVSDVEDGSYDVIFDDERLGEEGSMDISRLHILAQGDCFDVGSDTHHDMQQVVSTRRDRSPRADRRLRRRA